MNGSQDANDLGCLLKKPLNQFCFGLYQVSMNFAEGVSLKVESRLRLKDETGGEIEIAPPYLGAGKLLSLLDSEIVDIHGEANGNLSMEFSNKSVLSVLKNNSGYESYQIIRGATSIIV